MMGRGRRRRKEPGEYMQHAFLRLQQKVIVTVKLFKGLFKLGVKGRKREGLEVTRVGKS